MVAVFSRQNSLLLGAQMLNRDFRKPLRSYLFQEPCAGPLFRILTIAHVCAGFLLINLRKTCGNSGNLPLAWKTRRTPQRGILELSHPAHMCPRAALQAAPVLADSPAPQKAGRREKVGREAHSNLMVRLGQRRSPRNRGLPCGVLSNHLE